jgi:hypothetical protein
MLAECIADTTMEIGPLFRHPMLYVVYHGREQQVAAAVAAAFIVIQSCILLWQKVAVNRKFIDKDLVTLEEEQDSIIDGSVVGVRWRIQDDNVLTWSPVHVAGTPLKGINPSRCYPCTPN